MYTDDKVLSLTVWVHFIVLDLMAGSTNTMLIGYLHAHTRGHWKKCFPGHVMNTLWKRFHDNFTDCTQYVVTTLLVLMSNGAVFGQFVCKFNCGS